MAQLLTVNEVPATPLTLTLSTVSCSLNAQFKAEEWGGRFEPTEQVPMIKSNFAIKTLPGFSYTSKTMKKANKKPRKNKRIPFPKKERKRPGNGLCMNSCVSFIVLSKIIPNKHYDIKHFHTGKVQIPGCIRGDLSDVRDALNTLIEYEKHYFPDIAIVEELYINMINYKFEARRGYGVDLNKLLHTLEGHMSAAQQAANGMSAAPVQDNDNTVISNESVAHVQTCPPIIKIKYTPGNSMMYVYFLTPTQKKANKCIVVSISHNGKCNIQGGTADLTITDQIYQFMLNVLRDSGLYVKEAVPDNELEEIKLDD